MQRAAIIICSALLLINVAYAVKGVVRYGSQHIDAYGIWMAKATAIREGTIRSFLKDPAFGYSHQTYPLLLPYLMSIGGGFLFIYPVLYVVILWLLYTVLRGEGHDMTHALGWTTLASFMGPLIAQGGRLHAGLADIWITLLVVVCMLFVQKKQWWGVVGAVMIASMIKTEGIFLLAFLLVQDRTPSWLLRNVVAIIPFVVWQLMVRVWAIPSDVMFLWPGLIVLFQRLGLVIVGVGKEMVNWRNWYVVWALVMVSVFSSIRKSRKKSWGTVLGLMVLGYVMVYLFADMDTAAYVSSSVDRIMLQLLPLWWVMMGNSQKNSFSR